MASGGPGAVGLGDHAERDLPGRKPGILTVRSHLLQTGIDILSISASGTDISIRRSRALTTVSWLLENFLIPDKTTHDQQEHAAKLCPFPDPPGRRKPLV